MTAFDGPARRHRGHAAYGFLLAVFSVGLAGEVLQRNKRRAPGSRIPWQDLLLLGIATHKIVRIVAMDRVAKPIRAPFTEPNGDRRTPLPSGPLRRSLGELITCPYCMAPWVTLAMGSAYLYRPDLTRQVAGLFTSVSVSDFLNRGYARLSG